MVYEVELAIFGAFVGLFTPISIYFAKKLFDPIFQLRDLISKTSYSLILYGNIYSNPGNTPKHREVSDILRQHASDLRSKLYLVKYPRFFVFLGLIPPKSNVEAAHRELIGISNMLFNQRFVTNIFHSSENIKRLLGI